MAQVRRRVLSIPILVGLAAVLVGAGAAFGGAGEGPLLAEEPPPPLVVRLWDLHLTMPRDLAPAEAEALARRAARELARRPVELVVAERTRRYRLDQLGYRLEQEELVADLLVRLRAGAGSGRLPGREWPVVYPRLTLDPERFLAALVPLQAAVATPAKPARLVSAGDQVRIAAGTQGRRLEPGVVQAALRAALTGKDPGAGQPWRVGSKPPSLRVPVPLTPVEPEPSATELAALGVTELVAEYRTYYDPSIPRGENVARAAKALDGVLIRPGEVFSYNRTIGPVDAASGWQPAWVIAGGRLVPGVGGGVCQTATTLYGAALRAGLEVVERHPHDLPVGYILPSQDAAVAPGTEDLKLRNPGPGAVWIQAEAHNGEVTIALFGSPRPGQTIELESQVLNTLPPPVEEVEDPTLAPGARIVRQPGRPGLRSVGYRLFYQDGKLLRRERLGVDVYAPTPRIVARGPRR